MITKKFENHILQTLQNLNITNKKIAVALSGGSDSLALTLALHNLQYNILAIIVNHNLRKETDLEIKQTITTLKKFHIPYAIQHWDGKYLNNLEAEARDARYKLLINTCKSNNINILCIGHHADDQVETFYLNLARGSGLDGLCAMPLSMTINDIQIIRPMLELTKQHCREYLQNLKVNWCEDESNNDVAYKRNKIRFLLNQIEDKDLLTKRICSTIKILQEARQALDVSLHNTEHQLITYTNTGAYFNKNDFLLLTKYLQKSLLSKLISKLANKQYKPRLYQIENILTSIKQSKIFRRSIANLIISCKSNIIKIDIQQ